MREGAKAKFMQSQLGNKNETSSEQSVIVAGKESEDEEAEDFEMPSESITPP